MANEFYTLIVVPHAKARFRRLQVSVKFIKWAGAISATLALLLLISLVHYARIAVEVHELRRLRAEGRRRSRPRCGASPGRPAVRRTQMEWRLTVRARRRAQVA